MRSPLTAIKRRREHNEGKAFYPPRRNVRVTEVFSHDRPPDPVRYTETRGTRPARFQVAFTMAPAIFRAVQKDEFAAPLYAPAHSAWVARGNQLPFIEGTNINRNNPIAYGSIYTLDPLHSEVIF